MLFCKHWVSSIVSEAPFCALSCIDPFLTGLCEISAQVDIFPVVAGCLKSLDQVVIRPEALFVLCPFSCARLKFTSLEPPVAFPTVAENMKR